MGLISLSTTVRVRVPLPIFSPQPRPAIGLQHGPAQSVHQASGTGKSCERKLPSMGVLSGASALGCEGCGEIRF